MMPLITYSVSALLCLAVVSANAQVGQQTTPANWLKLDAGPFSILAPSGWEFHRLHGVDSYVGEFVGDGAVLRFDFGEYSDGYIEQAKEPNSIILKKSIGGVPAEIVCPRTPGHAVTGAYFRKASGRNSLFLWGRDLTSAQKELVLKIFETVRFGPPAPRNVGKAVVAPG